MFDELEKYKIKGHFIFKKGDVLSQVCNAPDSKAGDYISGIYLVYALVQNQIELVYIGRSGKISGDGNIQHRKAGCGGIKDRIVNGKDSDKIPRRKSWPEKMQAENINALDIYWYVTFNKNWHCPGVVEDRLLQIFDEVYQRLPRWNRR